MSEVKSMHDESNGRSDPGWMSRLVREPLTQFLVLGGILFALFNVLQDPSAFDTRSTEINLPAAQIEFLRARFTRTWSRGPTVSELQGLIDSHVREEVYYREALALGLDQNDAMVRRRMQQKLTFLFEDINSATPPSDPELRDWLNAHADEYVTSARTTFQQIYLGPEPPVGGRMAQEALLALRRGADPASLGEPTLLPQRIDDGTDAIVERAFGEQFLSGIAVVESGSWVGPVSSTFGAHLVYVEQRVEPEPAEFDAVRPQLQRDFIQFRNADSEERRYAQMLKRYQVKIEWPSELDLQGLDSP